MAYYFLAWQMLGYNTRRTRKNLLSKSGFEMHTYEALKKIAEEKEKNPYIPKHEIPKPSDKMGLSQFEANLMISALEIKEKKVIEIMIKFKDIYSIKYEEPLDKKKLNEILEKGFSRVPVFKNDDKTDLIGILRIKQLIQVDFAQKKTLKDLGIRLKTPLVIHPNMTLVDLLREFRSGKSHSHGF